ncbi:hypothetical protein DFH06DRAFT_1128195 [Mycena polygramma]|nr:hypothetical protein DFH06DRAFT_1128195 [Mycena polygramma]
MPLSNTDSAIVPGSDLSSPVVYRGRWKVRRKADKNATLKRGFGHSSRVGSQLSSGLQSKVEGRERKDQERPGGTLTHSSKGDIQTHLGTAVARRETETLEKPERKGDRSKKVLETLEGQASEPSGGKLTASFFFGPTAGNIGDSEHEGVLQQKAAMIGALMVRCTRIIIWDFLGFSYDFTCIFEPDIVGDVGDSEREEPGMWDYQVLLHYLESRFVI